MVEGSDHAITQTLAESAPHLALSDQEQLRRAYLGNVTWRAACDAVGVPYEFLPDTTNDLV